MVTKNEIEAILTDYGVTFTDALAEKLVEVMNDRWIPCKKRLPTPEDHNINHNVLTCYGNGSILFNTYLCGGWAQGNPKAWMRLPNPYKGE